MSHAENSEAVERGPGLEGRRAALGMVVPFDLELDAELWRWLPSCVDLLITRTPSVAGAVDVDFARQVSDPHEVCVGVRSVTAGRASVVGYACTSGSFVAGRDGEARLRRAMLSAGATDAVTTSGALVEALSALGIDRVAVGTPYVADLSQLLETFLVEQGVAVVGHETLGLEGGIWGASARVVAELARGVDRPDAQAIVLSCTNLPTYDLIAPLEQQLSKPVISANQATMWALARRIGRTATGPDQQLIARTAEASSRITVGSQTAEALYSRGEI